MENSLTNRQKPYINMFMGIASQERNPKTPARYRAGNDTNNTLEEDLFMNKAELVAAIADKTELSKKDSEKALKAFIDVVTEELKKGEKVQLVGFGTFETSERAAREGRNPQTGKTMKIPASTAPRFKAGKALKDAVN